MIPSPDMSHSFTEPISALPAAGNRGSFYLQIMITDNMFPTPLTAPHCACIQLHDSLGVIVYNVYMSPGKDSVK